MSPPNPPRLSSRSRPRGARRRLATRGRTAALAALLFSLFSPRSARADAPQGCADPRIESDGALAPRWTEALALACPWLPRGADGDPGAHLRLRPLGQELVLDVRLADGRTAVRIVRFPDSLATTLDAVLRLPVAAHELDPPRPALTPPAVPRVAQIAQVPASPPAREPAPSVSLDLGASLAGRVAGSTPYLSAGPALYGQLRIRELSVGLSARWEIAQGTPSGDYRPFDMDTFAAGVVLGGRLGAAPFAVELGLAPRVAVVSQHAGKRGSSVEGSLADVRLAALGRALVGRGRLRLHVELDVEVSPTSLRNDRRVDATLPPMPSWSAGLAIGATWGTP